MSQLDILKLSNYLQWFGSFCIFIGCVFLIKKLTSELLAVCIYAAASFFFQLLQFLSYSFMGSRYNNVIGNLYLPIETLSLLSIYYFAINRKVIRCILIFIAVSFMVFYGVVIVGNITSLNSSAKTIRDFIMILCSVVYFYFLMKDLPEDSLKRLPMFWINTAVLFFFSCTFMLSLSLSYLVDVLKDDLIGYWTFRNFLRVLFCIIICIGIWQARNRPPAQLA
jgi:hypothetical protein